MRTHHTPAFGHADPALALAAGSGRAFALELGVGCREISAEGGDDRVEDRALGRSADPRHAKRGDRLETI